jgi:hypothetical protein
VLTKLAIAVMILVLSFIRLICDAFDRVSTNLKLIVRLFLTTDYFVQIVFSLICLFAHQVNGDSLVYPTAESLIMKSLTVIILKS